MCISCNQSQSTFMPLKRTFIESESPLFRKHFWNTNEKQRLSRWSGKRGEYILSIIKWASNVRFIVKYHIFWRYLWKSYWFVRPHKALEIVLRSIVNGSWYKWNEYGVDVFEWSNAKSHERLRRAANMLMTADFTAVLIIVGRLDV